MRVLVFGASGMIGSSMFRVLLDTTDWQVWGALRSGDAKKYFTEKQRENLVVVGDVETPDVLLRTFSTIQPNVVINCIGLTKHHKASDDPLLAIPLNTLLPHRMAHLCAVAGARLIHISTDCVFSGARGGYVEGDIPDATDVYGKSKHLGEVHYPHTVTLRTSTIGHELQSTYGLLEWFLAQQGSCNGFSRAIFSGLPNNIFTSIVRDIVIPRPHLQGLYHVGGDPIDKYELLQLIAKEYNKKIAIVRDDNFVLDRSLNSERFGKATGYKAASWPELIHAMHKSR